MSKASKKRYQAAQQPLRRSQESTVCAFPAVAAYLSWVTKTSEEDAQKTVNLMAKFTDPARGKVQFDRCESPAERLFLLGGNLNNDRQVGIQFADPARSELEANGRTAWLVGSLLGREDEKFALFQQFEIEEFRVDFCLPKVFLAIEIDGHEFHERTKEQAAADKQRDRVLVRNGYRVLRFTGSEVYSDPAEVLAEVLDIALAIEALLIEASYRDFSRGVDQGYADGYDSAVEELGAKAAADTDSSQPLPALPAHASEAAE